MAAAWRARPSVAFLALLVVVVAVAAATGRAVVGKVSHLSALVALHLAERPILRSAPLRLRLWAVGYLVALFTAVVADQRLANALGDVVGFCRLLELGVSVGALLAVLAEAGQVVDAHVLLDVPVHALGAGLAEAACVIGAVHPLLLHVDVPVEALWVAALAVLGEELARGHLAEVVLVQELASRALFA